MRNFTRAPKKSAFRIAKKCGKWQKIWKIGDILTITGKTNSCRSIRIVRTQNAGSRYGKNVFGKAATFSETDFCWHIAFSRWKWATFWISVKNGLRIETNGGNAAPRNASSESENSVKLNCLGENRTGRHWKWAKSANLFTELNLASWDG